MAEKIILRDISYGEHERHKVDVFLPENAQSVSGLIFYIHGGAWVQGDKVGHFGDAEYMCNNGYVSAATNYRYVTGEITVGDVLDDITSALETVKKVCSEYGYDLSNVILSGGSAGGHISLLYAYTRKNEAPIMPVAACVYCPAVDCNDPDILMGASGEFEDWKYEVFSKCCGIEITKDTLSNSVQYNALRKISPDEYVSEDSVPTAVFQGRLDTIVPFAQVNKFLGMLTEAGVRNDLLIYENSDHALDKDPECSGKSREIIREYAEKYFG